MKRTDFGSSERVSAQLYRILQLIKRDWSKNLAREKRGCPIDLYRRSAVSSWWCTTLLVRLRLSNPLANSAPGSR